MNEALKEKIAKLYTMVERGGTEGERAAAKNLLDKLLAKYNLEDIELGSSVLFKYDFKYSSQLEIWLMSVLFKFLLKTKITEVAMRHTYGVRQIGISLSREDYIILDSSYEYFRRHMKIQWNKFCAQELKKYRKAKTRNKRRSQLQDLFFDRYAIASNLIDKKDLITVDVDDMSQQEINDRMKFSEVEGGNYNRQLSNGLTLPPGRTESKQEEGQLLLW